MTEGGHYYPGRLTLRRDLCCFTDPMQNLTFTSWTSLKRANEDLTSRTRKGLIKNVLREYSAPHPAPFRMKVFLSAHSCGRCGSLIRLHGDRRASTCAHVCIFIFLTSLLIKRKNPSSGTLSIFRRVHNADATLVHRRQQSIVLRSQNQGRRLNTLQPLLHPIFFFFFSFF